MITRSGLLSVLLDPGRAPATEVRFEADGRSMLPLIRPGDVLRMRRLGDGALKAGDVVAVRGMPGGGLLVHRVVRWRDGRVLVRGDNATVGNGEFDRDDVLGIVTAVERDGRSVWFGAGRLGGAVALVSRAGLINLSCRARLKFRSAVTRLRGHKGDDGNE